MSIWIQVDWKTAVLYLYQWVLRRKRVLQRFVNNNMMLQKSSSGAIHCGAEMVRKNECLCSGPGKMANCNPNMFN